MKKVGLDLKSSNDNSPVADSPQPLVQKKKRAKKPKVKTGCRTCKIRRVKCDETSLDLISDAPLLTANIYLISENASGWFHYRRQAVY
ncbi:BgTH12-05003 [Blumeria graminis f. sp. triticale]|uniref:BgTH12-05003 n=1 Tax=Blumeria graminis f. sp. triticale TaxID=1689686 RepID=A0A9W4D1I3_BLUGR|nr:BgTH12-05003 [Blumeria graminis f. sp. triticale]